MLFFAAYGVYVFQLIWYARAYFAYGNFSKRGQLLTNKLMLQGYNESRLKSLFCNFCCRYNGHVCNYKLSLAHMLNDLLDCRFHTGYDDRYGRTMGVTGQQRMFTPPWHLIPHSLCGGSVLPYARHFGFCYCITHCYSVTSPFDILRSYLKDSEFSILNAEL
jgi:hypothetical protein